MTSPKQRLDAYLKRWTTIQVVVLIRAQRRAAYVWLESVKILFELLVAD